MLRKGTRLLPFGRFLLPALNVVCIAVFLFLMVSTGEVYAASPVTVVLYGGSGEGKFSFSPPDGRFTVRFVHSWARTPVDEIFQVDERNNIVLKETIYEDFGAGLSHETGSQMFVTVENGIIHVRGIDRIIPSLQIRTGRVVASHTLIYGDRYVPFSDFAEPGSVVIFKVQNMTE